jgi:hypothetical protein
VERDAVHKALLSLLRQDVKGNLMSLCQSIIALLEYCGGLLP